MTGDQSDATKLDSLMYHLYFPLLLFQILTLNALHSQQSGAAVITRH